MFLFIILFFILFEGVNMDKMIEKLKTFGSIEYKIKKLIDHNFIYKVGFNCKKLVSWRYAQNWFFPKW